VRLAELRGNQASSMRASKIRAKVSFACIERYPGALL
jgi:hypothetical protein